jgi:adenine specific DNA methylase Mod
MTRDLYYGDNLVVLRASIADASVDLNYLDPPFNSKRDYNRLFKSPTRHEMVTEAASAGMYHSSGFAEDWPRLQILTIDGLLSGRERPEYKTVNPFLGFK